MDTPNRRPLAAYLLSGLMIALAAVAGAGFLVWCGLVRFLFNGWQGVVLLPFLGFIAWRSYEAARAAWRALPEAPPGAIAALVAVQLLVLIDQAGAWLSGDRRGLGLATLLPHIVLLGLMAAIFFASPAFEGRLIEADLPLESDLADPGDDDDDMMYLGGA